MMNVPDHAKRAWLLIYTIAQIIFSPTHLVDLHHGMHEARRWSSRRGRNAPCRPVRSKCNTRVCSQVVMFALDNPKAALSAHCAVLYMVDSN